MDGNLALKLQDRYTYKDYMSWNDNEYWELIEGVTYQMVAPTRKHQKISTELIRQFANYLIGKTCEVYHQPFSVRIPEADEGDEYINNVVLPDIAVVCDEKKLDNAGCKGAPDLIIEILSPSTAKKDLKEKLELYERSGVREYWIVAPVYNTVHVYILQNNKYDRANVYSQEEKVKVGIFPELEIDLTMVFK